MPHYSEGRRAARAALPASGRRRRLATDAPPGCERAGHRSPELEIGGERRRAGPQARGRAHGEETEDAVSSTGLCFIIGGVGKISRMSNGWQIGASRGRGME